MGWNGGFGSRLMRLVRPVARLLRTIWESVDPKLGVLGAVLGVSWICAAILGVSAWWQRAIVLVVIAVVVVDIAQRPRDYDPAVPPRVAHAARLAGLSAFVLLAVVGALHLFNGIFRGTSPTGTDTEPTSAAAIERPRICTIDGTRDGRYVTVTLNGTTPKQGSFRIEAITVFIPDTHRYYFRAVHPNDTSWTLAGWESLSTPDDVGSTRFRFAPVAKTKSSAALPSIGEGSSFVPEGLDVVGPWVAASRRDLLTGVKEC